LGKGGTIPLNRMTDEGRRPTPSGKEGVVKCGPHVGHVERGGQDGGQKRGQKDKQGKILGGKRSVSSLAATGVA